MSFSDYQETIKEMCSYCSFEKLDSFCEEIVIRMTAHIKSVHLIENEVRNIIEALNSKDWSVISKNLDVIDNMYEKNEDEAIEQEQEVIQLLDAVDSWKSLREEREKEQACHVSENIMNILDYKFNEGVSLQEWLTVPEILEEFNRQKDFLTKAI